MDQLTISYNSETIKDFNTLVALEVINPLSYIQFSVELITAGLDIVEQEEILKIIHKNVLRISSFANNIISIQH